jgi:hypothetical protein
MAASVAKGGGKRNTYCQHLKDMKLPVQKIQEDAAKCLILLGARGQKTGKSGFGVELGCSACAPENSTNQEAKLFVRIAYREVVRRI